MLLVFGCVCEFLIVIVCVCVGWWCVAFCGCRSAVNAGVIVWLCDCEKNEDQW